MQTQKTMGVI